MSEATLPKPEFDKPEVEIERAKPEDAEAICDIRDKAWLQAYPNPKLGISETDIRINAQGLNGEFVPRRVAHLKEKLSKPIRPDGETYVAKNNSKIVGFVEPTIEDTKRRIGAIYVSPEVQNLGIGGMLLQQALDWHGRDEDIYLEVVAYNHNAINFYKKFGFKQTDTVVKEEPNRPVFMTALPQIEMVLKAES
jgi:ribosomal protein S18 acetylase RimI-like enzyme